MLSFIITNSGATIAYKGRVYNVATGSANYGAVVDAIKSGAPADEVIRLASAKEAIAAFTAGTSIQIVGDQVMYNGAPINNVVANKIREFMAEGFDAQPLVNFLERLMKNPSRTAIDELYLFMEAGRIPLTPDGYLLAYKRVENDYYDCHSRTMLNKPYHLLTPEDKALFPYEKQGVKAEIKDNQVVLSMARNSVDDRRDNTCSYGLHFCSLDYLQHFAAGRTVVVKIDPADVVSIPSDYNNTKGRTCSYIVLEELAMANDTDEQFTAPVMDVAPVTEEAQGSFEDGYAAGYKAGRAKETLKAVAIGQPSEYDQGYVVGYKDGRGHKPKQF